ncbi:MAG: hypothetical protein ACRCYQ_02170 [Nocardioides sp.]
MKNPTDETGRGWSSFETALLAELRDVVTERAESPALDMPKPRRRGRAAVIGAAAAAAIAAVAVTVLPASTPAFAVDRQADGDVVVTVNRLDDFDGLEEALAEYGVTAEVGELKLVEIDPEDGPGPGWMMEPEIEVETTEERVSEGTGPLEELCSEAPIEVDERGSGHVVTIPANAVHRDRTLILNLASESTVATVGEGSARTYSYAWADGDRAAPCITVTLEAPAPE